MFYCLLTTFILSVGTSTSSVYVKTSYTDDSCCHPSPWTDETVDICCARFWFRARLQLNKSSGCTGEKNTNSCGGEMTEKEGRRKAEEYWERRLMTIERNKEQVLLGCLFNSQPITRAGPRASSVTPTWQHSASSGESWSVALIELSGFLINVLHYQLPLFLTPSFYQMASNAEFLKLRMIYGRIVKIFFNSFISNQNDSDSIS
jgi:hypothetical protein